MFIDFPEINVPIWGIEQVNLPVMYRIEQLYGNQHLKNLRKALLEQLNACSGFRQLVTGKKIAITVGSRGIPGILELLRTLCEWLNAWGASPFLIPSMGSHGGATAEGQRNVLESFGITEKAVGAPILSSMDVVQYGELEGTHLYCDKSAYEADGIIIFNKVKPHTDFRGKIESGLCKMIAIGLAKHIGASAIHARGFADFSRILPVIAQKFIDTGKVLFGIGVVQNAYNRLCSVLVVKAENLIAADKILLRTARERMAKFKCKKLDVLILDKIGKNISGFGYDPNVVGRNNSGLPGFEDSLDLKRLCILGLTEETHHNGCGISSADVTTRRCLQAIDWHIVWTNVVTSLMINGGKIPFYMNNDFEAIRMAIYSCAGIDPNNIRLARASNTANLFEIEVSDSLYKEMKDRPDIRYLDGPYMWNFDRNGNLKPLRPRTYYFHEN